MEDNQPKGALRNVQSHGNSNIYTYHLPYAIRREVCNLLDADKSWRTLGGQYFGLDATELTLIGQAYMRRDSPTDELLNKMDSANLRISDLCFYLQQMNHCRALEILRPYLSDTARLPELRPSSDLSFLSTSETLHTPTPSFAERPAAIMGFQEESSTFDNIKLWPGADLFATNGEHNDNKQEPTREPPNKCHRTNNTPPDERNQVQGQQQQIALLQDPGEEIVRMACANNRKRTSISDQEVVNQLRLIMQIRYNELKQASDDFSNANVLGNGGFASVYRGNWKGTEVAIKRLKCNLMDQALNELTILNSYRIDNILPIYGISIDGPEACLVYQFMANGSLEDRLSCKQGTPPLTWQQRALIGEGVAKGLCYLHTLRDKPLVHGDVKSANVLLDSQFIPKIGDFGLARQVFKGQNAQSELYTHCTVSSIHGTSVYLPPEYLRHRILSPAVDVYSYGIVLLEMATGKRAYDGKRLLIELVEDEMKSLSMGQVCYNLRDARLCTESQADLNIWYELLIKLGLNCAHKIKKKRLDMGQVLEHFQSFRTSSDLGRANSVSPAFYPLTSGVSSATRTATVQQSVGQDGGLLIGNGNDNEFVVYAIENQCNSNPDKAVYREQSLANNSALMSVEEGCEMKYFNLDQPMDQQINEPLSQQQFQPMNQAPSELSVDAMIPLLTELGMSPKVDD